MGADASRPQASGGNSPYDVPFDPRTLPSAGGGGVPNGASGPSRAPGSPVLPPQNYSAVPVNSLANETGVRCICPRCRLMLMPPAATFRCPGCHQIIQLPNLTLLQQQQQQQQQNGNVPSTSTFSTNAQGTSSSSPRSSNTAGGGGGGGIPPAPYRPPSAYPQVQVSFGPGGHMHIVQQPGIGVATTNGVGMLMPFIVSERPSMSPLEARVRSLLSKLPSNDPHSIFLRALLERLPRNADGTLDSNALNELEHQINAALRGAPEALINAMPTREFKSSALPKEASNLEEHSSCTVCMSTYEEKEILRTLPCLHSFHRDCIDPWLKQNKVCPMCKLPIDADISQMLFAAAAKEEAAVLKRGV